MLYEVITHPMMKRKRRNCFPRFYQQMQEQGSCMKAFIAMTLKNIQDPGLPGQIHYLHYIVSIYTANRKDTILHKN